MIDEDALWFGHILQAGALTKSERKALADAGPNGPEGHKFAASSTPSGGTAPPHAQDCCCVDCRQNDSDERGGIQIAGIPDGQYLVSESSPITTCRLCGMTGTHSAACPLRDDD